MPASLFSLFPCYLGAAVSVLCLDMMLVLLFFCLSWHANLWLQSCLWITSMGGCSSFCTSAFVGGQPWSTSYARMPRYSSASVATLISSAFKQSGMSLHDCNALMVMHMSGISSSPFHSDVWIANLWWIVVAQACTGFLCFTDGFVVVFFGVCVTG